MNIFYTLLLIRMPLLYSTFGSVRCNHVYSTKLHTMSQQHHNCIFTLPKFSCSCFVFVLSTLNFASLHAVKLNRNIVILTDWRRDTGELQKTRTFDKAKLQVVNMFHKSVTVAVCVMFRQFIWIRQRAKLTLYKVQQ
jgi:hypothetical protein